MGPDESKSYQLRVRVTPEERELLEKLRIERNTGETISDLVREAISLLTRPPSPGGTATAISPHARAQIEHLAVLLKREPHQVEEACIEGIIDLIDRKCEIPLIVMETYLHMKYRGKEDTGIRRSDPEPDRDPLEQSTV